LWWSFGSNILFQKDFDELFVGHRWIEERSETAESAPTK